MTELRAEAMRLLAKLPENKLTEIVDELKKRQAPEEKLSDAEECEEPQECARHEEELFVLVDTNIVMDDLLARKPFDENARRVIQICSTGKVTGFLAAHTIPNIFYLLRKPVPSPDDRRKIILRILKIFGIAPIDGVQILSALGNFEFKDFEDCLQDECAAAVGAEYIVTRNVKDFANSKTPALTPEEFIAKLE